MGENCTKIDTDRPVVHRKVGHCEIEWVVDGRVREGGKEGFARVEIFFINALPHYAKGRKFFGSGESRGGEWSFVRYSLLEFAGGPSTTIIIYLPGHKLSRWESRSLTCSGRDFSPFPRLLPK